MAPRAPPAPALGMARRATASLTELLTNIFADELKKSGRVQPRYIRSATILFADFQGFTLLAERTDPLSLVGLLDEYFTAFDDIMARHRLEKLIAAYVPGEKKGCRA
jgi:adenylate cyclase